MVTDPVSAPHSGNHTTFISGPPGTGKTTLAVQRLRFLLEQGIPAEQVLILVPQRILATPYQEVLQSSDSPAGGTVEIATVGGLARRALDLFWPLISKGAGFGQPYHRPNFLTLETAQYYMDRVADPFIGAGAFDGITIPRPRLVSQIIDNLNKSAAVGFAPDEIADRLKRAWSGDSSMLRIYEQVGAVALAFRQSCLQNNLLDWSLQIEAFWHHLLPLPQFRRYLFGGYRHLIVDNVEEDIPVSHDLLRIWLPLTESALIVLDTDGGYRVFLGADPRGALELGTQCREHLVLRASHVTSPDMAALGAELASPFALHLDAGPEENATAAHLSDTAPHDTIDPRRALSLPPDTMRFHPQMLDWVADQVSRLVHEEGLPAGEIAILAPFLSDALRFSLSHKLEAFNIPVRSHRPSRELREEPAARCLLTLALLAHPDWKRPPPPADVAQALSLSIDNLDPVRAQLLTQIVYRPKDGQPVLSAFHQIKPVTQERITFLLGGRYDELCTWLQQRSQDGDDEDLDHFFSRLFGEILSQPGFGFHGDMNAGATVANLIESVQKFRQSFPASTPDSEAAAEHYPSSSLSQEYLNLVERGVVAAQYVSSWQTRPADSVLLVPAYTFLMMNHPVTVQFWLDAGSGAWVERIFQPLTHPHVLSRGWSQDEVWTDDDEVRVREQALGRLILGLSRRCRQRIVLASSELNERGYEQQGPLLVSVQRLLRQQGTEPEPVESNRRDRVSGGSS